MYDTGGELELSLFCFNRNAISSNRKSLSDIYSTVLGFHLPKNNDVRLSNWEALELSDQQKHYAALDAYGAIVVYKSVKYMKLVNEPVSRSTCSGTFVGIYPENSSKLIAATVFGHICNPDDDKSYFCSVPSNISVSTERNNLALIKFVDVKRPDYIL
ncbi:hypothetical protein A0J61_10547 [Choanephora cucurbitarum]|uniref:3'-5' exonuclease domain-containing protein n=1 Tax=Choanephora cucurbitarum TaxID=101091 RepID=A0A1C7MWZ3_9FUNG|nr:hypothetical protein A0J61_10547 [Choanephora cucurbitarum]